MTMEDYRLNLLNCRTKDCKTEVRISYIKSLEQQLSDIQKRNKEFELKIEYMENEKEFALELALAQLSDMQERIDELEKEHHYKDMYISTLEEHNKELSKDFTHSKYVNKYKELKRCKDCIHWLSPNKQYPSFHCSLLQRHTRSDFYCSEYELKDKQ